MGIEELSKKLSKLPNENKTVMIVLLLAIGLLLILLPKLMLAAKGNEEADAGQKTLEENTAMAIMELEGVETAEVIINYAAVQSSSAQEKQPLQQEQSAEEIRSVVVILGEKADKKKEYEITNVVKTILDIPPHKIIVLTKKE